MLARTPSLAFLVLATPVVAAATTYLVDGSGSGDFVSLQAGLDAAVAGDTVLVAPGEYLGPFDLTCGVVLASTDGPEVTHLVGQTVYRDALLEVRDCADPRTEVIGLTLRDHRTNLGSGGGILVRSSIVRIRGNVIRDNTAFMDLSTGGSGAGIFVAGSQVVIEENEVRDNRCRSTFDGWAFGGVGICIDASSGLVRANHVEGNRGEYPQSIPGYDRWVGGGIAVVGGASAHRGSVGLRIVDNTIVDNSIGAGGGMWIDDPLASVIGNTITGNHAPRGGGVMVGACDSLVANTISGNTGYMHGAGVLLGSPTIFALGKVLDNVIDGNVTVNPEGGGGVVALGEGVVRFERNQVTNTVGGYGIVCEGGVTWTASDNEIAGNDLGDVRGDCPPWSDPVIAWTTRASAGPRGRLDSSPPLDGPGIRGAGGAFRGELGAPTGSAPRSSRPDPEGPPLPGGRLIWVPGDAATIGEGLALAVPGDTVFVRPGVYEERVEIPSAVVLISQVGPTSTEIRGDGAGSTVTILVGAPGTHVEGFTVTGGASARGGGVRIVGGWPVVRDCVIEDNAAVGDLPEGIGGGVSLENTGARLERLMIRNNSAPAGGGLAFVDDDHEPEPTVLDCRIEGNRATWFGGGMLVFGGRASVDSCVVFANSAGLAGGGIHQVDTRGYWFERSTIAANHVDGGLGANVCYVGGFIARETIISHGTGGPALFTGDTYSGIAVCCCLWSEEDEVLEGNFLDPPFYGFDNVFADPLYCDLDDPSRGLEPGTPCDAECGLMGRYGVGCTLLASDAPPGGALPSSVLTAHPTPTLGRVALTGPFIGRWRVTAVDVTGREVWRAEVRDRDGVLWSLTTSGGEPLPAGVYLLRAEGPRGVTRHGRVVVARPR